MTSAQTEAVMVTMCDNPPMTSHQDNDPDNDTVAILVSSPRHYQLFIILQSHKGPGIIRLMMILNVPGPGFWSRDKLQRQEAGLQSRSRQWIPGNILGAIVTVLNACI